MDFVARKGCGRVWGGISPDKLQSYFQDQIIFPSHGSIRRLSSSYSCGVFIVTIIKLNVIVTF